VVLDTLRRPASGVMVQLLTDSVAPGPSGVGVTHHGALMSIDSTDAEGRFTFPSLAPRQYALYAQAVWVEGRMDSLIVGAGDTLSVEFPLRTVYHAETPQSVRNERLTMLAAARARWSARRPARYRLTGQVDCFCLLSMGGATTFEFHGDSLVGIVDSLGQLGRVTSDGWKRFAVSSLFNSAESAIRNLERIVKNIEYDPVYGVPTLIDTDTAYLFTDSWFSFRVTGFRPLP
jgi:hypothetical protein